MRWAKMVVLLSRWLASTNIRGRNMMELKTVRMRGRVISLLELPAMILLCRFVQVLFVIEKTQRFAGLDSCSPRVAASAKAV